MVDNYIRTTVLNRAPLHQDQHAYRVGRSTETALYQLTSKLRKAIKQKDIALCAFLDIEGAFDNASHDSMQRAWERRQIDPTTSRWMASLLSTRKVEAKAGNTTVLVDTTRGCPQGGVLSPLMWSLLVDDLLCKLSEGGVPCQGYADDIVIIVQGKFEETLCDLIQSGLKKTEKWCRSAGLGINPKKTTVVAFTNKRKLNRLKPITVNDTVIELSSSVKYLGITLDRRLNWNEHIEAVTSKATRALMVCRKLVGKKWGCKPEILRWMYNMIVRPAITYGAAAWWQKTNETTTRKKLGKVQRLACVCITGAMRTCPTASMEYILGLSPLHLVISREAKLSLLRMERYGREGGPKLDLLDKTLLSREYPLLLSHRDDMSREFLFETNFLTTLGNKEDWAAGRIRIPAQNNNICWYTDGSRTEEGTGAGVFGPRTRYSEPMGKFTSIFQAEVHAIERCAQFNLDRGYVGKSIAIMSDSQAAIMALRNSVTNSKMVKLCKTKLNQLGTHNKVTLAWVPGHTEIEGNEQADTLARKGAATPFVGPEPFCGIGKHTIQETFRTEERKERKDYWNKLPGLKQSKILLREYSDREIRECLAMSRNNLRILTGFLTGHCLLGKHLTNIGIATDPICRYCNSADETPIHLLSECEATLMRGWRSFGYNYLRLEEITPLSPRSTLRFLREVDLLEVL